MKIGVWYFLITVNALLYAMDDDKVTKFKISYVVDDDCFKRSTTPAKKNNAVREFTRDFILRNTPFEKKFRQFDSYTFQKTVLNEYKVQEKSTSLFSFTSSCIASTITWTRSLLTQKTQDIEVQPENFITKAPLFNWEKLCCIPGETELKCGYKNYLQDFSDTQKGVQIYDASSGDIILRKSPVAKVIWSDDRTCCAVIQKESESSCIYKAFLRDLKNNKEYFVDCAAPGPDGLSHFIENDDNVSFVTKMENILYITCMRPDGKTYMVGLNDFTMMKTYFCDTYIWIHYKENRKKEDPKTKEESLLHIPAEKLVVYEILNDGFKNVAVVIINNSFKYIFNPYGAPENKNYISFYLNGMVHVYDAASAQVIYKNKQNFASRLVGMWNADGTLYAVSDVLSKGSITIHTMETKTAVELKNPDKEIMIADGGFQDHYVGVSTTDSFMVYDCKDGGLVKKIPAQNNKNTFEYGFCAPGCVYLCTDEDITVYNFIEYAVKVDRKYVPCQRDATCGKNYYGYIVANLKNIFLINLMTASERTFSYDYHYNFWFNASGDTVVIAYGDEKANTLDIIDSVSGAVITTLYVDGHVHNIVTSLDNNLCAMLFSDKKTVVIYDLRDISKPLQSLFYKNDVTSIKFDDASCMFVATTNKETYVYSVQ